MRYSGCNLAAYRGVHTRTGTPRQGPELTVLSCDYNGWADVPEDEREAMEAFESACEGSANQLPPSCLLKQPPPAPQPQQKAA